MLLELNIKDFAIIDNLHLRLHRLFNVFTGETGAGKSIIIDAMSALLGGKIGVEVVRAGTDRATVEGDAASIVGDIADPALVEKLFERPVHRMFHLAGIVSGRAETDFALGKQVNLDATLALLERCREQAHRGGPVVRFVYSSSIAVFGTPLPERIDDTTQPLPTLSPVSRWRFFSTIAPSRR